MRFQTRLTHLRTFLRERDFSGTEGYDHFERALGTRTRIFHGITPAYSSSKIISRQNATSDDVLNKIQLQLKYVKSSFFCYCPITYSQIGTRVTISLRNVPSEASIAYPLVLFALLQHEHKVSVLNFTVQRNTEYDGSVRSKVHIQTFFLISLLIAPI